MTWPSFVAARHGGARPTLGTDQDTYDRDWAISVDFDGTITRNDVTQALLAEFADPDWRALEAAWEAGRIDARTCLRLQTELIRVSEQRLAGWVDEQPIDPHVVDFMVNCHELGLDVQIVSDGYDWVIRRVMGRLGLLHIPVTSNHLEPTSGDRWALSFPHSRDGCGAGTCKCAAVSQARPRMHIGDGLSDVCVSNNCQLVFAKDRLLADRSARGQPSSPYSTFADIQAMVADILSLPLRGRSLKVANDLRLG